MIIMEEQKKPEIVEQEKAPVKEAPKKEIPKKAPVGGKLFVVRARGNIRIPSGVRDTLEMLRLYKVNYCIVLESTAITLGMLKKVKDFVTWGPADQKIVEELFAKRGLPYKGPLTDTKKKITYKGRYVEYKGNKYKKFFALNPPRKGYGKAGIKTRFAKGGALGNRSEKINALVTNMM
jgi:large subunit ribosomal protein L30